MSGETFLFEWVFGQIYKWAFAMMLAVFFTWWSTESSKKSFQKLVSEVEGLDADEITDYSQVHLAPSKMNRVLCEACAA